MSRTSKTLLRLGVPSLAAATMIGGVPLFLGTALANHIGTITVNPVGTASAAAGSCQAFTADVMPSANNTSGTTVGETLNIILTDAAGSATSNASFCTLPTGTTQPQTGTVVSSGGPQANGGSTDQSKFTVASNPDNAGTTTAGTGRVTFGVTRNEPTTAANAAGTGGTSVQIQAFYDANNDNTFNAGEPQDTSAATFTAGGPAGSNANQDAVTNVAVTGPNTAIAGESRTFRVTTTNGTDAVNGATVNYQVAAQAATSTTAAAAAQSGSCGATNNDGVVNCTVTLTSGSGNRDIIFFVNQTDGATGGFDAGQEPSATQTVAVSPAQAASTIVVTPQSDTSTAAPYQTNPAINPRTDGNRTFRVVVDNNGGTGSSAGRFVNVSVTGGSGDETVNGAVGNADATTADNTDTTTANGGSATDSFVDVVINDPTPVSGETLTVTGIVRGQSASSSSTLSYVAVPTDARNISLAPNPAFTPSQSARTFTATVIDGRGNPVAGVTVDFSESGPGSFRNGSSNITGLTTDRNGQVSVETTSLQGEQGQQTITATITTTGTQTGAPAGNPSGNTRAGNNSATATNNVGIASPSPSATATASTSPSATSTPSNRPTPSGTATPTPSGTATPSPTGSVIPPGGTTCVNPAGISLSRSTIFPGTAVRVTITAPSGAQVELQAYSRPSDQFKQVRSGTIATGQTSTSFDVTPGTNTRLFAACVNQTKSASASVVINVRTAISLTVVRNGRRNYTFKGTLLPRRSGQLITLYRITSSGQRVLTSQVKSDASGVYSFNRRFTGSGTFGFLTRTGQNLTNAFGESNTRGADVERGNGQARPTAVF